MKFNNKNNAVHLLMEDSFSKIGISKDSVELDEALFFCNKEFPHLKSSFRKSIQYLCRPFFEAYQNAKEKLLNVLVKEPVRRSGTFIYTTLNEETLTTFYDLNTEHHGQEMVTNGVVAIFSNIPNNSLPQLIFYSHVKNNNTITSIPSHLLLQGIIYVDYLSYEMTQQLLARRVIGRPIPFFCLAFCLSGGLPRDLIRVFRKVYQLSEQGVKKLAPMTLALLKDDVLAKMRATRVFLQRVEDLQIKCELLRSVYETEMGIIDEGTLVAAINRIKSIKYERSVGQDDTGLNARLATTADQLIGYLYLSITILQFFINNYTETILVDVVKNAELDGLAKARQSLAIDAQASVNYVNLFRNRRGMEEIVTSTVPGG